MIQVDLHPFHLLFLYNSSLSSSSSSSSGAKVALGTNRDSDETRGTTKILQITKEHLTKTLDTWDDAFLHSLELFPVMTERNELNGATTRHVVPRRQGWTTTATTTSRMMSFAGSAFFDHDTVDAVPLQDRVDQVTMLAFLGTNLTTYTRLLQMNLNMSITEAQLYTIHGYRMAYTNGTMQIETENSNELLLHADDAMVWIHLVAIGLLSLVGLSLLFIGGYQVLMSTPMQQLQYSRVASVSPVQVPLGTKPIAAQIPHPSSRP
ncbi:hypothetical protein MHU86_24030 [Fragilaria crotonensis]|nr:hypothetical protein MHU86_24030 [Fragilaria crotonensis]